ncbi:MAG: hypothetical protein VX572_12985, partial [Chloroflexota bacterium]|nr:hypothetical protein [Chloroflexota bacterium]
ANHPDLALFFQSLKGRQMGLSINQIVHLEQVDVVNTEVLKRLGDLLLSSFLPSIRTLVAR